MKKQTKRAKLVPADAVRASRQAVNKLTNRIPEKMIGVYVEVDEKKYLNFKKNAVTHKITFAQLCRSALDAFLKLKGGKDGNS